MTDRKKIILFIISLFLAITILRETGILNLNYFKSKSNTETNTSWTDKGVTITIDSATMGTKFNNSLFAELPVIVLYDDDTLYKETKKGVPIIVTIDTLTPGFLWVPLYKASEFSSTGTSTFSHSLTKTPPEKIELFKPNLTGHYKLKGNISITGICSHHHAVELIKELVTKSFVAETKKHFSTLD